MKTMIYSTFSCLDPAAVEDVRRALQEAMEEEPTEAQIWDAIADQQEADWNMAKEDLFAFFDGFSRYYLMQGSAGRWNGKFSAGCVFDDFQEFLSRAVDHMDDVEIYDENGHFFVVCFHHDGRNVYEIKAITDQAADYIQDYSTDKTEEEKSGAVFRCNIFSRLPHFARDVYGVKEKRPRRPSKRTAPRPAPVRTAA